MGKYAKLAAFMYLAFVGPAFAAGYGLREFSADAMGTAYAGAAANGTDPSYQAYNPASIASVDQTDFSITAIGIIPSSSASYTTALTGADTPVSGSSTSNGFISGALVPELAMRSRLSDRWAAGLVVYAPWGLSTNYPANLVARYYALTTKLMTANITPSISFDIVPKLTIAAGLQIEYAKGTLSSAVDIGTLGALYSIPGSVPGASDGSANLGAENWGTGFVLGLIAHPLENVTVGLSYHSSIEHHLSGAMDYTLDSGGLGSTIKATTGLFTNTRGSADITTPDTVNFGLQGGTSEIKASLEVDWTNWEKFHNLQVVTANPAQPVDLTAANWKAAWFSAIGVEYHPDGPWSFRTGVAYDESPIPDATLNPRIPDADRIILAAGATYRLNDATDIKFAFEHLFIADRNISLNAAQPGNALRGTLAGRTQSSANAIGVQFVWRLNEVAF